MSKIKKFGAFAGVFTPSILTILGVIMYMRLGWVVGQAGLIGTLIIVLVSHVISFSTGLSISSIATDKKIKIGGIYYMLSRSLGLPMGGAIGIALFVGTALSISLYIIGFVESFLSIPEISEFLHLGQNINDYRIAGTTVIITLVIVAFISTSLAIKTQFIILTLIVLSLVSIGVGLFSAPAFTPRTVELLPYENGKTLAFIFAIFFPAVTGFTAGVAMSGDLKDPKKNIPVGTLASISVGMLVYVLLTIGFAFFIDRSVLISDPNFLSKVVWNVPLLLAGIWGATLSSALGGILGGPRILQALSRDSITPRLFGKGYGENNEPRNALILTFLIAEIGILIGELNAVAEIVSMFYLASYGFINLAYSLESWASSDFRPSFKIPRIIGVIGFFACFIIMLFLNMMAMILALVIMVGIYSFLKRKELKLDFGDVWQSVWTSVIRIGLHRMDNKEMEERNWQPNIILFSGGTNKRPHLIEFGKFLVGAHGMLSNFDLIEEKGSGILFPRHEQSIPDEDETNKGVFTRRQSCSDIYDGMEMIARVYGFSGIEPNTVVMGWARESDDPVRFVQMLHTMSELDFNIMLMDYDKRMGFGRKRRIDIWWRGGGNNGNFAITSAKFILNTNNWRDANLRLLIVNQLNDQRDTINKKAEKVIENLRIKAEIRIINNQIEQKSFYDIIRAESIETDLTFLGIPEISTGKEHEFIRNTTRLLKEIGTVVLIKASSQFKKLSLGEQPRFIKFEERLPKGIELAIIEKTEAAAIPLSNKEIISEKISALLDQFTNLNKTYHQDYVLKIVKFNDDLIHSFSDLAKRSFRIIGDNKDIKNNREAQHKLIAKAQNSFLIRARKILSELQNELLDTQQEILNDGVTYVLDYVDSQFNNTEKYINVTYTLDDLLPDKNDDLTLRSFKFNKRLKIRTTGKPIKYQIKYKKLIDSHLPLSAYKEFYEVLKKWGVYNFQFVIELQKLLRNVRDSFLVLDKKIYNGDFTKEVVDNEKKRVETMIKNIEKLNKESQEKMVEYALSHSTEVVKRINNDITQVNVNQIIRKPKRVKKTTKELRNKLLEIPGLWYDNQNLIYNASIIELMLLSFENKLRKILEDTLEEITNTIDNTVLTHLVDFSNYLSEYQKQIKENINAKFEWEDDRKDYLRDNYYLLFKEIIDITYRNIKVLVSKFPDAIDIMGDESYNNFMTVQYDGIEVIQISASRLLDYLTQSDLLEPLQHIADELPDKLQQADSIIQDIIRLVSFSMQQPETSIGFEQDDAIENLLPFIVEQQEKVKIQIQLMTRYKNNIKLQFFSRLTETIDKFSLYSFGKLAVNMKQYVLDQESKKRFSKITRQAHRIKKYYKKQVNHLWYRRSEALLLANKLNIKDEKGKTIISNILDLVDSVSISSDLLENLPFYYQQLFLRKHNYYNEFWYGRELELLEAEKAIKRYRDGFHGALLIKGAPGSGRTFFAQYFCNLHFNINNIYILTPPVTGSISTKLFRQALLKTLRASGGINQAFANLPPDSVLIIDDMELWWEKSDNGFAVIDQIANIIDKNSDNCFFVVNVNSYAYELMKRIKKIENYFLSIINCQPFSAEYIKQIIMFRHKSSGIRLQFNKRTDDQIRSQDLAGLFTKYFKFSKGNVGVALQAWISNITAFENNTITIKEPKIADLAALRSLDVETYIYIVQFLLHKRLSMQRLLRISMATKEEMAKKLNYLLRAGLIKVVSHDTYELNPYISNQMQEVLKEKNLV